MPAKKLKEFLDAHQVKYMTVRHWAVYTVQEIAVLSHIRGKGLAKTLMVKADGKMAMAVLPAPNKVDSLLGAAAGAESVRLATEAEFKSLFPDCEAGAMPPFGNPYGMSVFADTSLAGSHSELIRMAYQDFERLVQPASAEFSARP